MWSLVMVNFMTIWLPNPRPLVLVGLDYVYQGRAYLSEKAVPRVQILIQERGHLIKTNYAWSLCFQFSLQELKSQFIICKYIGHIQVQLWSMSSKMVTVAGRICCVLATTNSFSTSIWRVFFPLMMNSFKLYFNK